MLVKKQRKYLDRIFAGMRQSIRAFFKKNDLKKLHHLRIEIKKLNAFVILSGFSSQGSNLNIAMINLQKINRKAGKIRNIQLTEELLSKYHEKILYGMKADRKNLIRDFRRKCDSYLKKVEETKSFLTEQITDLNENNIYEPLKSEILKLHIAFQCIHVPQNLHQCRNNLKGLIYSYKCLGRESRNKLCLNIKYLKELEKNIGQWHDISILVKTLSKSKNQKFKKSIKRLSVKSKKRFEKCRALAEQFLEKSIKESNTSNRQDQFT